MWVIYRYRLVEVRVLTHAVFIHICKFARVTSSFGGGNDAVSQLRTLR
jgi:hypothetical protein